MRKLGCLALALLLLMTMGCSAPIEPTRAAPTETVVSAPIDNVVSAPSPNSTSATPAPAKKEASVVLEPATPENPYPLPQLNAEAVLPADLTQDMLNAFVKRFCYDLFNPCRTLEGSDFSGYVEDNISTHLALRWGEFFISEVKKSPRKQVIAITSVEASSGKREEHADSVSYSVMCELRYDRKDPSVNGCNIDTAMEIAVREGKLKIVSLELAFDSRYRDLLAKIQKDNSGEITIEQIDKAFEALLKQ